MNVFDERDGQRKGVPPAPVSRRDFPRLRLWDWLALFLFVDVLFLVRFKQLIENQLVRNELGSVAVAAILADLYLVAILAIACALLYGGRRAVLWLAMLVAPGLVNRGMPFAQTLAGWGHRSLRRLSHLAGTGFKGLLKGLWFLVKLPFIIFYFVVIFPLRVTARGLSRFLKGHQAGVQRLSHLAGTGFKGLLKGLWFLVKLPFIIFYYVVIFPLRVTARGLSRFLKGHQAGVQRLSHLAGTGFKGLLKGLWFLVKLPFIIFYFVILRPAILGIRALVSFVARPARLVFLVVIAPLVWVALRYHDRLATTVVSVLMVVPLVWLIRGRSQTLLRSLVSIHGREGYLVRKFTVLILVIMIIAGYLGLAVKNGWWPFGTREPVTVVHWSNSHLTSRPGLLNQMAEQFNKAGHRTKSGKSIEVKVFSRDSVVQANDLLSRVSHGVSLQREIPDPIIVSPQSASWLTRVNQGAGRTVVDISNSRSIASALAGIVTYRDMAEALGWPNKDIGYADIIALRKDPKGWANIPGAKAEWGQKPLIAYTDPTTSVTGRSVLFSLYAIGAGKTMEQLTPADVTDPKVVSYVKQFQGLVDHYMATTLALNTKVYQGPHYGHFFMLPEDNLVSLYEGTEHALIAGVDVKAPAIDRPMVMIYPREGAVVHNNIAGIVKAPWVTNEQMEAADQWVDFLLQDEQQRAFMGAGFRTKLPLTDPSSKVNGKFGLEATPRAPLLSAERMDPAVAAAIEQTWQDVKKPGIVTFVLDTSGSMSGDKLDQAKNGMLRALDSMAQNNQVGFLTFSDTIHTRIPVSPLAQNRYDLANAIGEMRAGGGTALYDAVKAGIEMTDSAPGADNAIRAVVVLTDGQANGGNVCLDSIIRMMSRSEVDIEQFCGLETDATARDKLGRQIGKKDILGIELAMQTGHPVQLFFIGIGKDADIEIGRMLAQATGAEFQGVADKDLAKVLETLSKYF